MKAIKRYLDRLHARIKESRSVFIVYTILRLMVLAAMIRSIIIQNYEGAATCLLVLALLLIPSFLEGALKIQIPPLLEGILYCFIFAAEILGELDHYYTKIHLGYDAPYLKRFPVCSRGLCHHRSAQPYQ